MDLENILNRGIKIIKATIILNPVCLTTTSTTSTLHSPSPPPPAHPTTSAPRKRKARKERLYTCVVCSLKVKLHAQSKKCSQRGEDPTQGQSKKCRDKGYYHCGILRKKSERLYNLHMNKGVPTTIGDNITKQIENMAKTLETRLPLYTTSSFQSLFDEE